VRISRVLPFAVIATAASVGRESWRPRGREPLHPGGGGRVPAEHVINSGHGQGAVPHDHPSPDHRVPRRGGPAAQPRLHGVGERASEGDALLRPAHEVGDRAHGKLTDLPGTAKAGGTAACCHVEDLPCGHPARPVALAPKQQRRPCLDP
jgi:hypothetical protein